MADIHFPAYLQVSKDCLYHNTCVLITALLTEIIFLQRILQECFLLPNHSRGDRETRTVPCLPRSFTMAKRKALRNNSVLTASLRRAFLT